LIAKYDPLYNSNEVMHKGIPHKGDGFLMALEVGACPDGQVTCEMSGPIFKDSVKRLGSNHLSLIFHRLSFFNF